MTDPTFNALNDWLAWMETLHPSEIDLGLSRIRTVADRLGINKNSASVIAVAGTNGKGSCVATIAPLLIAAGKTVGAYTSPHILQYNERVKIQGLPVSDQVLCEAFKQINQARQEISLTYFEFGTLAAMLIFQNAQVDYWLLEVGLGGRLDAVNIIDPDIAVITSIDLDHEAWLGNTREAIAREKLGILRANTPCVCAEPRLTDSMKEIFEELNTPLYLRGEAFDYQLLERGCVCEFSSNNTTKALHLPLRPNLPMPSVAAAIQVLALCDIQNIDGLIEREAALGLTGRYEVVETELATVILDVAHNPAATHLLADTMRSREHIADYAVVAMMCDKKTQASLEVLTGCIEYWLPTEIPDMPRSESASQLQSVLLDIGVSETKIDRQRDTENALRSVFQKIRQSKAKLGHEDKTPTKPVVLVFGSFYTVAAAHHFLTKLNAREFLDG